MKRLATYANGSIDYLAAIVLVLVPFYAFLTVWGSSLVGHYTVLRLWDDILLLGGAIATARWLATDKELREWFGHSLLVRLIVAYITLTLLLGVVSFAKGEVTTKALLYGLLVNLRFVAWFLVVFLAARRSIFLRKVWSRLILVPAVAVVVFGVLQYTVLPHNFLSHFGYNAATTIAPIETINHNNNYIRVQSTTRGANPLGAYLIIVITALSVLLMRGKRRVLLGAAGLLALAALYASGSRSAWIGTFLSLCVIAWMQLRTRRARMLFGWISLAALVVVTSGYLLLKNNVRFQNEILHTQANSAVKTTSNGAHVSALKAGLKDMVRQPFGDGPGTAGPASVYNGTHSVRIAEDYYVQVGQETGWLGLAIFLCILVLIAIELYGRAGNSLLARVTFASFIGIAFVNLLSHAWADDTLAYIWWGLAAVALVKYPQELPDV